MGDISHILFDEKTIQNRVAELALRISKDYAGKELVLISVLRGALLFTADLVRKLTIPVTIEFIQAASYGASTISSRCVVLKQDINTDIKGKHVLLIDTIIDTGETLACLSRKIAACGPATLGMAVLLDKKSRRTADVMVDYCGFEIPDAFVVGYGMDFAEHYRNLPYIAVLKPLAHT